MGVEYLLFGAIPSTSMFVGWRVLYNDLLPGEATPEGRGWFFRYIVRLRSSRGPRLLRFQTGQSQGYQEKSKGQSQCLGKEHRYVGFNWYWN